MLINRVSIISLAILMSFVLLQGARAEKPPVEYQEHSGVIDRQGGDTIAESVIIPVLPFSCSGTTEGFTNDYDEECPYDGSTAPDVVYRVFPCLDGVLDIALCGESEYDTKLFIYDADLALVACNDDMCPYYVSELSSYSGNGVPVLAGEMYYIIIDGYGHESGYYTLDITGMRCDYTTATLEANFSTIKSLY